MKILDGKKISKEILQQLKQDVSKLPFKPIFCDVLVGDNSVSSSYVNIKGRTAERVGLSFRLEQLPVSVSEGDLKERIGQLNKLENLCGLIVQLPLPPHINRQAVLDAIDPHLDIDCLTSENTKKFYQGHRALVPPTAGAIMKIVESLPKSMQLGQYVIVGQGQLVGKPVTELLKRQRRSVTIANSKTTNLATVTQKADVLISGTGQAGLISSTFVKNGCAVIDAGTAELEGGIVGDVDFESIKQKAGFITPVPGGVGPVTVSMLLYNVVEVAKQKTRS
jgi:methylenetetrahydrofolate dehydrogenase (NADP+)/methenyltetrahydrofolate cyclohydrolase